MIKLDCWIRHRALRKTELACPSRKYSFNVVLNRLEYLTNSRFRCSSLCFPDANMMNPATSLTASSSFLWHSQSLLSSPRR